MGAGESTESSLTLANSISRVLLNDAPLQPASAVRMSFCATARVRVVKDDARLPRFSGMPVREERSTEWSSETRFPLGLLTSQHGPWLTASLSVKAT